MRPKKVQTWSPLRTVRQWLNGSPRRTFVLRLIAITFAVSLASFTRVLNVAGIDDWLERLQLEQMDYSVNVPLPSALRLVYIKEDDVVDGEKETYASRPERWRKRHAMLLRALANAPLFVAFDLRFDKPESDPESQAGTSDLGTAIREATTRVLVGADLNDNGVPDLIDALKSADSALIKVGGVRLDRGAQSGIVRRYVLARSQFAAGKIDGPQPAIPSLAVMMHLAERNPSRTAKTFVNIDPARGELILSGGVGAPEHIRCRIEREASGNESPRWLATIPLHYPRAGVSQDEDSYVSLLRHLPNLPAKFKKKIVLIGAQINKDATEGGEIVRLASDSDKRVAWGYQVHARVFGDLSQDSYPRPLQWWWNILILFLLALIAGLGRGKLPSTEYEVDTKIAGKRKVPIGLLILLGVYVAIVWLFYRKAFILFDVAYGAIAVVAAYFLCGNVLTPRTKPESEVP
jgi:CHASE2 domain-containing sensor protein